MPLIDKEDNTIITAHASKQSKVSFKIFEVHTSVLVPLMMLPVFPFWTTLKIALITIFVLVLLERKGWTLAVALKRMRSFFAGRYRYRKTKRFIQRSRKI